MISRHIYVRIKALLADGRQAIEKKLAYLLKVQRDVLSLHNKGLSPNEIRKKMFPKRHPMHYISFFENSPKHIISSILE